MPKNDLVLIIFAPILILTGIGGFLIPEDMALMSGVSSYNIFHIIFGLVGLIIWYLGRPFGAAIFNIGFGLIDLYQAVASFFELPPTALFQYTIADDILHLLIGLFLFVVGLYGMKSSQKE